VRVRVAQVELIEEPERVRIALSPVRRRLLERLREPASATQIASELGLGRQRVNYHLRALESADLLELVEERPRRGFVERVLRTRADFVVDPSVLGPQAGVVRAAAARDRFAAEHLVDTAAGVVRDVARMQASADREEKRLLTFTIEAEVRFTEPGDVARFTERLAELVAGAVAEFDRTRGRPYRLVVGGHPAPDTRGREQE
jgi:DNA-binding transcriptional ArsR family regulator